MNLFQRTRTKDIIAVLTMVLGFGAICFIKLTDTIDNRIFDLMFLVGTYFFGSSSTSSKKDESINSLTDTLNKQTTQ